jgi:hypothetical protein
MQLTNNPGLTFSSLKDELFRVYEFADGSSVKIESPQALNYNAKSGGHRVLDGNGVSHYIPAGWNHLYWKVRKGSPAFAF